MLPQTFRVTAGKSLTGGSVPWARSRDDDNFLPPLSDSLVGFDLGFVANV